MSCMDLQERSMSTTDLEIEKLRREWGTRLLILGHHYQRAEVLKHVDFRGDSLELARRAEASTAERILFCGVWFMAESADILTTPDQIVHLSEANAGCPMADMADAAGAETALQRLKRVAGNWTPVVYVNSSAEVKAFVGRNDGSACTSSNCLRVLRHYFAAGQKVFFLPDEHLGRNSAHDLGLSDADVLLYDPALPDGGLTDAELAQDRMVVWKGFCHVHTNFTAAQVAEMRDKFPEARVVVHPESPKEVVRAADAHGSTAWIIDYVRNAPDGSTVVVGTERELVMQLAAEQEGRVNVLALLSSACPNMARTRATDVLLGLRDWPVATRIAVAPDIAAGARLCLERMLQF